MQVSCSAYSAHILVAEVMQRTLADLRSLEPVDAWHIWTMAS
jgi:hypothetical protein